MTYTYDYPRPSATLDAAILRTPNLKYPEILLIKRKNPPFPDKWALPGGFLEMDESPLSGAARELQEETGLVDLPLKPLFTCGEVGRDPRGRTITMVFGCLIRDTSAPPEGADDAKAADWFPLNALPEMAFDHDRVIAQIEANLLWQTKTSIVGKEVFHEVASAKDIMRLHQGIIPGIDEQFIANAVSRGFISYRDGICEYIPQVPAGPDWHPAVW